MDNQSKNNIELPSPSKNIEIYDPIEKNSTPESSSSRIEQGNSDKQTPNIQPNPQPFTPPVTTSPQPSIQTSKNDTSSGVSTLSAEDIDLIEKAWVNKAKKVVNDTRNDPRKQNTELAIVKADYIQRRFQKSLKIEEDNN